MNHKQNEDALRASAAALQEIRDLRAALRLLVEAVEKNRGLTDALSLARRVLGGR